MSAGPAHSSKPRKPRENPYLEVPGRAFAERTLAYHYANLSAEEALLELERREIAWTPAAPPFSGVRTPIRLATALHGVAIHASIPEAERATSSLVSIVCEAADERLFHFELTPDCDAAHADHVHLELRPGAHSFIFN